MSQVTRDSNGRFTTGNPGGPGRPRREIEEEYLLSMETAVNGANWQAIVDRAVTDAIAGDAKARMWLSSYLLGMPISRTEAPQQNGFERVLLALRASATYDEELAAERQELIEGARATE